MTNSEAIMVPTYSRLAMLGSNPIAIAMPAEPYPFFFDSSTTVVTRGKLEIYNKLSKPLPNGWAPDENGKPCTDASRVLANIVGKNGIDVNINTVAEMRDLCDYLRMDSVAYLGDVDFSSAKQSSYK